MRDLQAVPIDLPTAGRFVAAHHRHHPPAKGWKWGVGCMKDGQLVGVATVGRPVSRALDDGKTLEVTRCCTDGTKNVASFLYGRCVRAAVALGFERVITYTLRDEPGHSLRAVGAVVLHQTRGRSWDTPKRRRIDSAPIGPKTCWSLTP